MKWKQDKTYVYYIPEYDTVYTARYIPSDSKNWQGEPWTTEVDFGDKPILRNFNPDVVVIYTQALAYNKLETVYIGEL